MAHEVRRGVFPEKYSFINEAKIAAENAAWKKK